jgi:hypothetical protein
MGGRLPEVTADEIRTLLKSADEPVLTASEILAARDGDEITTRDGMRKALKRMARDGDIGGRKAANVWVFWHPDRLR